MGNFINGINCDVLRTMESSEVSLFATTTGGGNGSSWSSPCTFREAVAKCTGTKNYKIYLGAGTHNTDNGVDANGTTIDKANVTIIGMLPVVNVGSGLMTTLANSAASVDSILRVTASRVSIIGVTFSQIGQTDKSNLVHLELRAGSTVVYGCRFAQGVGDTGVTGIFMTNSSIGHTIKECRFFGINRGLDCGAASQIGASSNTFMSCVTGLYASSADADVGLFVENEYIGCTTAVNITTAQAKTWYSYGAKYFNNTTNMQAMTDYAGTVYIQGSVVSGTRPLVYPPDDTPVTGGTGIECETGDGVWTWTASPTTIIPADTVTTPFVLSGVNLQDWSAEQTFRIELFYGDASPTVSLGIHEFTVGDPAAKHITHTHIDMSTFIPANACVGAKVCSDTAGVDSVTLTLEYDPI